MSFDHVRGAKRFNLADAVGRPWPEVLAEAAKCEVVCLNCHAVREQYRALDAHEAAALDAELDRELRGDVDTTA